MRQISEIAREIRRDWKPVNYAAEPYLREMAGVSDISDPDPDLGFSGSAQIFVRGFLGNAQSWRGEVARRVKRELNEMLKAGS